MRGGKQNDRGLMLGFAALSTNLQERLGRLG